VARGRVEPYEGDLDDYRRYLLAGENHPTRREAPKAKAEPGESGKRRQLKQRAEKAEREVAKLAGEIQKLDEALAAPDLFRRDPAQAAELSKRRASASASLERAETLWLEANNEYETA